MQSVIPGLERIINSIIDVSIRSLTSCNVIDTTNNINLHITNLLSYKVEFPASFQYLPSDDVSKEGPLVTSSTLSLRYNRAMHQMRPPSRRAALAYGQLNK